MADVDHAPPDTVDAIARRIRSVVESDCRVRFVYLYGSRARGDARPGSDVDLAVSLRPSGSLLDDARLHDQLAAALDPDDVDLLIVDSAPLWLQFRVLSSNGGRDTRLDLGRGLVSWPAHRAASGLPAV
jgi:predicted nucleotidyltransferase